MQRLALYIHLGTLFTIITPHILADTECTEEIQALCQSATQKNRTHESPSLIACQNQKAFPRKKRVQINDRIGLIEEKLRTIEESPNKKEALSNFDQRIAQLKEVYEIKTGLNPRLLMTPLERVKLDQRALTNLRERLRMLKNTLQIKQKNLAGLNKNFTKGSKKINQLTMAHLTQKLATSHKQLSAEQKGLSNTNKNVTKTLKKINQLMMGHLTHKLATSHKQLSGEQKDLSNINKSVTKALKRRNKLTMAHLTQKLTGLKKRLTGVNRQLNTEQKEFTLSHKNSTKTARRRTQKVRRRHKTSGQNIILSKAKQSTKQKNLNLGQRISKKMDQVRLASLNKRFTKLQNKLAMQQKIVKGLDKGLTSASKKKAQLKQVYLDQLRKTAYVSKNTEVMAMNTTNPRNIKRRKGLQHIKKEKLRKPNQRLAKSRLAKSKLKPMSRNRKRGILS